MAKTEETKLNMSLDEVKAYIEKDPDNALLIAEAHFGFVPDYKATKEGGEVVTKEEANKAVFDAMLKKMEEDGQGEKDKTGKKAAKKTGKAKTAKPPATDAASRPRRGQVDYSTMATPYRPGCSQGVIFDLLSTNKIKAAEVKDECQKALDAAGKTTKNIGVLITASIGDATRRGWKFDEKDGVIVVSHPAPETATA